MIYYIVNSDDIQISEYYGTPKEATESMVRIKDKGPLTVRTAEGNIEDTNYYYLARKRVTDIDTLKVAIVYCICNCSEIEVAPRIENENDARRVLDLVRNNQRLYV